MLYVLILFIVHSVIVIVACLLCIVTLGVFSRMVFLFDSGFVVVIVLVFGVWRLRVSWRRWLVVSRLVCL